MFDPLKYSQVFNELREELLRSPAPVGVVGCLNSQKISLLAALLKDFDRIIFVTQDEKTASDRALEARTYTSDTHLFLSRDLLFNNLNTRSRYLSSTRIEVLRSLVTGEKGMYFCPIDALMDPVPDKETLFFEKLSLRAGMSIDLRELSERLFAMNYERREIVESGGEFAIRGGIADIFPIADEQPVRLEFFGDEITSMRRFNTYSQRSTQDIGEIEVYPLSEHSEACILDYFGPDSLIVVDEPQRILERGLALQDELRESGLRRHEENIEEETVKVIPIESVREMVSSRRALLMRPLDDEYEEAHTFRFDILAVGHYKGSYRLLVDTLLKYSGRGYRVSLMTPSKTRASRIASELREQGLRAYCPDEEGGSKLKKGETEVVTGTLEEGYEYPDLKYVLMTESDMFGRTPSRRRTRRYEGVRIGTLNELKPGDYVVHESHGIGIYRGLEHVEREGVAKDFIRIEYADSGQLYLPATRLDLVQKYSGAEGKAPRINRLNGAEWARTKERVAKQAGETARELVSLYAARLSATGHAYEADSEWQKEFEELFPFEETPDQLAAIASVKADMESTRIMDRLICGDVGYGKTEIAMRAAFKAVSEGKQVAMLVPTTLLASQHYRTFSERFEKFPVRIEMLSRFRDASQNKRTAEALRRGEIDIVIGTHRLLSSDVGFKDLGLLIVDEEQRFGVAHKEKIKQLKSSVEALSLSATPIPRTLHMSLAGIRDLSMLDEPPFDRVPIETYVLEYNDEFVREAVMRELKRAGQVFYVYNRVRDIEKKCEELRLLLPGARIEYAHGQMPERELEDIMRDFVAKEIDILLSTTIIESGLDIPNANTIIVDGAESMGLAQLYQLRGRVGRSGRMAYAFFMYRKDRILKEEAQKRLSAIREFTGFGSGIKIALRDLEIRGAGNVLGTEQHGDIGAVGYDLYCKLLRKAVEQERGIKKKEEEFETTIDCAIDAFIPSDYIADEFEKLEIYKKIAEISSEGDAARLREELTDRFGAPPPEVINLMDIATLRARAHLAYVTELSVREGSIVMHMFARAKVRVEEIPSLVKSEEGRLRFITGAHPRFVYSEEYGVRRDTAAMIKKAIDFVSKLSLRLD